MNSIQRLYDKMGFEQLKLTCCWKKLVQNLNYLKKKPTLLWILNYQCQHNNDILLHVTWHIILRISHFRQWNARSQARSKTDSTWLWYSSAAGPHKCYSDMKRNSNCQWTTKVSFSCRHPTHLRIPCEVTFVLYLPCHMTGEHESTNQEWEGEAVWHSPN